MTTTCPLAVWQTSTTPEDVLDSLHDHHQCNSEDTCFQERIDLVDDLVELLNELAQHNLTQSVSDTRDQLCTLICAFQSHNMGMHRRARTALRVLDQTPYFQQLMLTQQQNQIQSDMHRDNDAAAQRQQRRQDLEATFSHQCPKCNAPMESRENKTSKRTFWGCSRYGGPSKCQGTRGLTPAEQVFMTY